jgi:rod shape-determining protein MreB
LRDGVIADFLAAEEMLRQFIKRAKIMLGFRRPRILICVPAQATPVERRAVYDTAMSVGARKVYMIAEPVAASLGAGLPINEPCGSMVVDIGGGTADIAMLSGGSIVVARTLRCAGNAMDEAIIRYVRRKHHLLIGEANAERIKIEAGTAQASTNGRAAEVHIRGRDLRKGWAKSAVLTPKDIAEALTEPVGGACRLRAAGARGAPARHRERHHTARRSPDRRGRAARQARSGADAARRRQVPRPAEPHPLRCEGLGHRARGADRAHLLMRP